MTWRDDLRRVKMPDGRVLIGASFRGVPFFVDASERSGGRRTVTHEFPLRDDPFVEDMGRRARTFRLDGYVLGDDYIAQRDKLLDVLENVPGPGELVHPYHGVLSAVCTLLGQRESRGEGGFASFSLEFAEAPTQAPAPTIVDDGAGKVDDAADAAATATDAEFAEKYDTTGMPSFSIASSETALNNALQSFKTYLAPAVTTTQELAALSGTIALMTSEASSLVRQPATVLDQFRAVITSLTDTVSDAPGDVMDALFDAYAADLGPVIAPTTATREREAANQAAFTAALRRVIAVEAARIAPLVPYVSIDDALAARDQIAAILEEQAGEADDTAYPALVDLRSQVLRAVPGGQAFANVSTVTRNVAIPSLLLTYQIYGSVARELDVVARNRIRHPGFVSGDVKVLSDG